ncbi:hypothetical protein LCGC14_2252210, partial [marine sediment metagenome]
LVACWEQGESFPTEYDRPDDPNGPAGSKDLIDGVTYHLEGSLDDQLSDSDWGNWEGEFDWIDSGYGRQGLVGLVNRQDSQVVATFHLDNEPEPRPVKHLWIEMEYYFEGEWEWQSDMIPAFTDMEWRDEALGDGWRRRTWWFEIEPNPISEELIMTVSTYDTGTLVFDYIHVATECVPEPSTFVLACLGLLGLGCYGYRRRKSC